MLEKVAEVMFTFKSTIFLDFLIWLFLAMRYNLDLLELFCYKFLEAIGAGAKVLFIPNCVSSKSILYIGSEFLPQFRTFRSIDFQSG